MKKINIINDSNIYEYKNEQEKEKPFKSDIEKPKKIKKIKENKIFFC
jgi:hypothetical protein